MTATLIDPAPMSTSDTARPERVRQCHVVAVGRELRDLLGRLEPETLVPSEADSLYRALDQISRSVDGAKTRLAARAAESSRWRRAGCRDAAEYLARTTGTSVRDARDQLTVSRQIETLPATRDALAAGTVSTRQAVAIADAATADPTAEQSLLSRAATTTIADLRREAQRVKAAADPDPDATHRRIHRDRSLRQYTDAEGAWHLHASGPAELGSRLDRAIEDLVDQTFRARRDPTTREPRDAYAFDALIALADRRCEPRDATANGNDRSEPRGRTGRSRARTTRYRAVIRVDHAALVRGQVEPHETCEIAGLGPIPARRARELLGESVIDLVVTKGTDVVNVTHLGRGVTAAQRVALAWRQPTCSVEGCVRTRVEIDHRDEWSATRQTRLLGLDPLCPHHHQLKTTENWALVNGHGDRPMVPPDHPDHPRPRRGPRGARNRPPPQPDAA